MKRVCIESPLSGDFEKNIRYARYCMYASLMQGESPFLSHLLYTQCLDDEIPEHREIGLSAGFAWGDTADIRAFYVDFNPSFGMAWAFRRANEIRQKIEIRRLPDAVFHEFIQGIPAGMPTTKAFDRG